MIYLHRLLYIPVFIILVVLAALIGFITYTIGNAIYALFYYIKCGKFITEDQAVDLVAFVIKPIIIFLEYIKPKR